MDLFSIIEPFFSRSKNKRDRVKRGKRSTAAAHYAVVSGKNATGGWAAANRFNKARGGVVGGWASIAFANIVYAHSDVDEMIEEFSLDQPDADYGDCYMRAYIDESIESFPEEPDPHDVEDRAYDYAIEMAENWLAGIEWIPKGALNWAFYILSDHNKDKEYMYVKGEQ